MSFQDLKSRRDARQAQSSAHARQTGGIPAGTNTPGHEGQAQGKGAERGLTAAPSTTPSSSSVTQRLQNIALAPSSKPSPDAHLYPELETTAFEVRVAETSGRGLYAKRAIAAGTTLLRIPPRTAVLSTAKLQTHCSNCYQPAAKVQRCAACKALHYCSAACQKADWAAHKPECAALKKFRVMWAKAYPQKALDASDNSWVLSEAVRALGRMCWARKAARVGGIDPDWWKQVAAMVTAPQEDMRQLLAQVHHLKHYLSAGDKLEAGQDPNLVYPADMTAYGFASDREVMDMCSAFMTNSFTLTTSDLAPVGVATSPSCALFNHSCAPNAVIVFPKKGTGMNVVAIADIKQGEEVLTSYVDVSQPRAERQVELSERYGFTCKCSLCEMPAAFVDPRWSVKHVGCREKGDGNMPDLATGNNAVQCGDCHEIFTVNTTTIRALVDKGKRIIAQDDAGALERNDGIKQITAVTTALSSLMPDSSHLLLQLLHLHSVLLLPPRNDTEKNQAVELLTRSIEGARGSYPANHPAVALWKAERARVMALQQERPPHMLTPAVCRELIREQEAALPALQDAMRACDLAFGPGGEVAERLKLEADHSVVFVRSMRERGMDR